MKSEEVEEKKRRFREFLGLSMKHGEQKQSWNDTFMDFMAQPLTGKSKAKREKKDEPNPAEEKVVPEESKDQAEKKTENEIADDKRLFVMNLSYQVTKEELQSLFGKYGQIDDIEIPFRKGGKGVPLGIGFVKFAMSESAIQAFAELDQTYF